MHLLFVTPMFQHPLMKCSLRQYHFIRELSARHQVSLLSVAQGEIPPQALAEVRSMTSELELVPLEGANGSRLAKRRRRQELCGKVGRALTSMVERIRPDVVVFHGKEIFTSVENLDIRPLVIDVCDAAAVRHRDRIRFQKWTRRPASFLKYLEVRSIERRMMRKSAYVSFISRRDWREAGGRPGDSVIPNGVDLEYFRASGEGRVKEGLVFTGVMSYPPNEDAAMFLIERVRPILQRNFSDLPILIVGRDPGARLLEIAGKASGVKVTGAVEDVRPYLEEAALFACPIRFASGTQNKVLEAMAMGLPVVTTPVVAEGVRYGEQSDLPLELAIKAEDFALKIGDLLRDRGKALELGRMSRDYVERNAIWASGAALLEKLCRKALSGDR